MVAQTWYQHANRHPCNVDGPFYTLGYRRERERWSGECLACGLPEHHAPMLLAAFDEPHNDTVFVKQPASSLEIECAIAAAKSCCTEAIRYGGTDPEIIGRLPPALCDYEVVAPGILRIRE